MMFDLQFYWRLILNRAPAMIALIIICTSISSVIALRAPTTFRTSATMLVESAQISEQLAASTVRTAATETIEIIRQRLLTRANLLDLARELDVFEGGNTMSPDAIVAQMRSNTSISSQARRGEPIQINIAFEARTGQIAADVVNEFVTQVITANVELRTGRAEDTMDFFEQEVDRLSGELDLRSARITQFQTENADALPGGQAFRLQRQTVLQERINGWQRERANLEDQAARLIAIFRATGNINAQAPQRTDAEIQLEVLEDELANALVVLSDTNPRVIALQRRVEALRAEVVAEQEAMRAQGEVDGDDLPADDPNRVMLDLQLSEINSEIEELTLQITEAQEESQRLEDAILRTPANAISLESMERDYEIIRRQYDSAISRLNEASTGERIELTSRGQRMTLVEPASVPESPHSPNRFSIVATGAGAGIGLAALLFAILEVFNRAVRRPVEVTRALGIQPIATIPYIESRSRRLTRRIAQVAVLLLVLGGVPAALWAIDTYYMPLDLLAGRIMNRLGLG